MFELLWLRSLFAAWDPANGPMFLQRVLLDRTDSQFTTFYGGRNTAEYAGGFGEGEQMTV